MDDRTPSVENYRQVLELYDFNAARLEREQDANHQSFSVPKRTRVEPAIRHQGFRRTLWHCCQFFQIGNIPLTRSPLFERCGFLADAKLESRGGKRHPQAHEPVLAYLGAVAQDRKS